MCDSNYVYNNLYSNMTIIEFYTMNGQLNSINNSILVEQSIFLQWFIIKTFMSLK